jgi:hypothetical protein
MPLQNHRHDVSYLSSPQYANGTTATLNMEKEKEKKTDLACQERVPHTGMPNAPSPYTRPRPIHNRFRLTRLGQLERVARLVDHDVVGDVCATRVARPQRTHPVPHDTVLVVIFDEMPFADLDRLPMLRD